jgi:hypothetical protein
VSVNLSESSNWFCKVVTVFLTLDISKFFSLLYWIQLLWAGQERQIIAEMYDSKMHILVIL